MSSDRVATYSADETVLSIAGVLLDSGYADGEFVSIEPTSDDFVTKVGADGEVIRARTNDRRATIKVKLLQSSLGNDLLIGIRTVALASPNGADVGVFLLTDVASGAVIARADKCWIKKPPTVARAREGVEYEWTFETNKIELTPVGSPSL